jgi:polysaccharide pyruvyl transferase WcaK-like protein
MTRDSRAPRVTVLDHYSGSNLGDAAIIDATIDELRARLPGVELTGVSLNNANMQARHGIPGIALCATPLEYYRMSVPATPPARSAQQDASASRAGEPGRLKGLVKRTFPGLWNACRDGWFLLAAIPGELQHFSQACRHLRSSDLLVIAGGGQLDEEWGGPWGHPYALFKWTLAGRVAGTPVAVASVGACTLSSRTARLFIGLVLRLASYRSFRDTHSRDLAHQLYGPAKDDSVVPDLAFAIRKDGVEAPDQSGAAADTQPTIAISPIAFAKADAWPSGNPDVHERYVRVMASLVSTLLRRGTRLVFVYSSLGTDQATLHEILGRLDADAQARLAAQARVATIRNWPDFLTAVRSVDCVVASRLHSAILSFIVNRPVIAVSFDPKVNWLLEDFACTDVLLDIHDFTEADVLDRLDRLAASQPRLSHDLAREVARAAALHAAQFDRLAALTNRGQRAGAVPVASAAAKS